LTRGPIKCAKTKTTATIVKAVLVHVYQYKRNTCDKI